MLADYVFEQGATIEGEFRVSWVRRSINCKNEEYMVIRLGDVSGEVDGYCWQDRYKGPEDVAPGDIIKVSGVVNRFDGKWQLMVNEGIRILVPETNPALLLPAHFCPRPDLIERLARAIDTIATPVLKQFVIEVILDSKIIYPFVSVAGSCSQHHSYPGGTLEHSLECFDLVRAMPDLTEPERDIASVAALFHDIGKIRTNRLHQLTPEGFWVHHNALTFEVLAVHLQGLDRQWQEAGSMLRHIWSALHKGHTRPMSSLVALVAFADQYSAERDNERSLFEDKEPWKSSAVDNHRVRRMRLAA